MSENPQEDKTINHVEEKNSDKDMLCGTGLCYPSCLQRCRNITSYSVFYGLTVLVTNALSAYISSQITTLEKQFNFSSSQSGFMLSCNDIGFILTVLFVSHFGLRFNIPRVLAFFTIIYGLSGIATSFLKQLSSYDGIPLGFSDKKITNGNDSFDFLCFPERNSTDECQTNDNSILSNNISKNETVFILMCLFMGIQGFGKSPRSSLGTYYIDKNVPDKTRTGFYLGITTTMGLFGPFLAIMLGGLFGQIPVDLKDTNIEPSDPRWIGAWWIGFLLFGILGVVTAIPLIFYPRYIVPKDNNENDKQDEDLEQASCLFLLKDIPKAIFRIFRNPIYTLIVLSMAIMLFGTLGAMSFGPKYIENQFNIPTWKANIILGAEKLVTASLGTFLGGYLTSRFKLTRLGCLKMLLIVMFITTTLNSLNFIFGCPNPVIQKVDQSTTSNFCDCGGMNFMPVCDESGKTFFSPCHAGCTNATSNIYQGCSNTQTGSVLGGLCDTGCPFLIPYIAVQVISTFCGTLSIIPFYLVILRSLKEKDRSIAFGMQSFLYALVVFIPAPIAFGHLFDGVCKEWKSSCGSKGSCVLYDIESMRYTLTSVEVAAKSTVFILFIFIFHLVKKDDAKNDKSQLNHELEVKNVL